MRAVWIKYVRKAAGCAWTDYKTNTEIEKTEYNPSFGQNTRIQRNSLQHIFRNPRDGLTSIPKPTDQELDETSEDHSKG